MKGITETKEKDTLEERTHETLGDTIEETVYPTMRIVTDMVMAEEGQEGSIEEETGIGEEAIEISMLTEEREEEETGEEAEEGTET